MIDEHNMKTRVLVWVSGHENVCLGLSDSWGRSRRGDSRTKKRIQSLRKTEEPVPISSMVRVTYLCRSGDLSMLWGSNLDLYTLWGSGSQILMYVLCYEVHKSNLRFCRESRCQIESTSTDFSFHFSTINPIVRTTQTRLSPPDKGSTITPPEYVRLHLKLCLT